MALIQTHQRSVPHTDQLVCVCVRVSLVWREDVSCLDVLNRWRVIKINPQTPETTVRWTWNWADPLHTLTVCHTTQYYSHITYLQFTQTTLKSACCVTYFTLSFFFIFLHIYIYMHVFIQSHLHDIIHVFLSMCSPWDQTRDRDVADHWTTGKSCQSLKCDVLCFFQGYHRPNHYIATQGEITLWYHIHSSMILHFLM